MEIEGIISIEKSVAGMLSVISTRTKNDSGTFWTWEGKVDMTVSYRKFGVLTSLGTRMVGLKYRHPYVFAENVIEFIKSE